MKRPWLKFYPADWRSDPRLRICSLAARGLWIDLITYMHEGEPYGHLTVNGTTPNLEQVASLVGRPAREVERAFEELIEHGVCSTDDGGIISRRMVRDKAKEERDKANGKGGGNPELLRGDKAGVNPPDKAQKLEARDQISERKEDTASAVSPSKYAFEAGVIRLTTKDFQQWKESFSHLDLAAELVGMRQWADEQGPAKWFHAVSGALAKRNREIGLRKAQAAAGPPSKEADQEKKVIEIMRKKGVPVVFADEVPGGIPGLS